MPAVPGYTEEGSVGYSNFKNFGHAPDMLLNTLLTNMIADQQDQRQFMRAVNARAINKVLDYEATDANADSLIGLSSLGAGQIGAKVAQSTPPESGVGVVLAQLGAVVAALQQIVKGAQTTPPDTSK